MFGGARAPIFSSFFFDEGRGTSWTRAHICFTCVDQQTEAHIPLHKQNNTWVARARLEREAFLKRQDTYGGVEGKGALALEDPVSGSGDSDGGHVRDQQLSQVCSHLRIPAARSTVPRSLRSCAVRGEDAIFKALRRYIPRARGM